MAKKKWRKTVRGWMHDKAIKEASRKSRRVDPAFMYRWEHVQAVVTTSLKLADVTGADVDIVEAAAWLHDICKEAKDRHPQEGAKYARKHLPKTDFPKQKIEAVAQAIEDHMGLWRDEPLTELESQVLWDADKLTKIGVLIAFHWTGNGMMSQDKVTTQEILERLQSADFRAKTVASMHTKAAKKAAKARFEAYDAMVAQLSAELHATDIK